MTSHTQETRQPPSEVQLINIFNGVLTTNNTVLTVLVQRNLQMTEAIADIQEQIDKLKRANPRGATKNAPKSLVLQPDNSEDQVIAALFGGRSEYRYELQFVEKPQQPLYKERNFKLEVKLVDSEGRHVLNSNPIPLKFRIYTNDEQPVLLELNKNGQPITKGSSSSELYHGVGSFNKLHLREVSSYYKDGTLNMMVCPEPPSFSYNAKESSVEREIDYTLIKPLVCNMTVRAKKKFHHEN